MELLVQNFLNSYHDIMDNNSDPRVNDWPLMSSPFPTLALCLSYAYFVKVLGPRIMDSRKPMNIRGVLIVYNFVQVIFSSWMFYEGLAAGWLFDYSFRCQPIDRSNSLKALRMAKACWWYYFSKFTEFLDTIFFVLRKKNDQISTLHVVHHGVVPLTAWTGTKFLPGGHGTFFGLINTFIHIFMYSYYLLAALGPRFKKYLWWKKYLTVGQMVQFVLAFIHSMQLYFIDCDFPKWCVWMVVLQAVMFFFLFADFYKQAYKKKQQAISTATKAGTEQLGTAERRCTVPATRRAARQLHSRASAQSVCERRDCELNESGVYRIATDKCC